MSELCTVQDIADAVENSHSEGSRVPTVKHLQESVKHLQEPVKHLQEPVYHLQDYLTDLSIRASAILQSLLGFIFPTYACIPENIFLCFS